LKRKGLDETTEVEKERSGCLGERLADREATGEKVTAIPNQGFLEPSPGGGVGVFRTASNNLIEGRKCRYCGGRKYIFDQKFDSKWTVRNIQPRSWG